MSLQYQVLLFIFAVSLTLFSQSAETRKTDLQCVNLLRSLLRNPPNNTRIAINIRLSKARYRCYGSFKLVGKEIRTCRKGKWKEKEEPKCLGPCGKPDDIPHATYVGSSFRYNDKLRYSCKKGYTLSGPKRRTCRRDGQWSKGPTCSRQREENHMTSIGFGEIQIISPEAFVQNQECTVVVTPRAMGCRNPGRLTIRNGNVSTSDPNYRFGATLLFECNEGYELKGPDTITCLEFGWSSRRLPYCKEKACPDPGRPENGDRFGHFKIGSMVRFSCQSGFELLGSRERTCMENMEWNGSLTTCQDGSTDCPVLGTPISGRKYGSGYNSGDIVRFECKHGYVLKGSAVRKCMENGTWNGTEAICRDEFEDQFKDLNTTAFILRKNVIDTLMEYTCNHENETGCNKTNVQGMDTRGRAINLNSDGGLDLVFILDASSSVKREGFTKGLGFAKELIKTIGMSKRSDGTRVALVTFGTEAKLEFNLGDAKVDTIKKVMKEIDKVHYMGGATASTLALQLVRRVVVPNAREDSKRAMMFITDGQSNVGGPPKREAKILRDQEDFEIYAIGVGRKVRRRELMDIASAEEGDDHVISLKDYSRLEQAVKKAVKMKIDYSGCGESPVTFRARIVGGRDSERGWWPWQIGIYKLNNKGNLRLTCGGALIARRWVLTAAHCFYYWNPIFGERKIRKNPQEYQIKAGDHSLIKNEKSQQDMAPETIFVHQKYVDDLLLNDIALVKLTEPMELGRFVRTVCLPKKEEKDLAVAKKYGYAAGWGATKALKPREKPEKADRYSTVLKYSAYTIQENRLCSNRSALPFNSTVSFCAGDGKGGNDTCRGDSGGAFVREGRRGDSHRWIATGLVSWGEGCAQKDQYGYYTRVHPFIDWIKKTMDANNSPEEEEA